MVAHRIRSIQINAASLLMALAFVVTSSVLQSSEVVLAQPVAFSGTAAPDTGLTITPASLPLSLSGTGMTTLEVRDVADLYGVEFHLTFNPNLVEVQDADPTLPGVQIGVGSLFSGTQVAIAHNEASNIAGKVDFVASLRGVSPFSGTEAVAVITWKGKTAGASPLTLVTTKLSDRNGQPRFHTPQNGEVVVGGSAVVPPPSSPVSPTVPGLAPNWPDGWTGFVQVLLQGRTDHGGTTVYLTEEACSTVQESALSGQANAVSAVTNAQGNVELFPVAGRAYLCLLAVHDKYLSVRQPAPFGHLPMLTLQGGNVVADTGINIFDLARVANALGTADRVGDVNGDGKVDIADLAIAASNFGKDGPQLWQ